MPSVVFKYASFAVGFSGAFEKLPNHLKKSTGSISVFWSASISTFSSISCVYSPFCKYKL